MPEINKALLSLEPDFQEVVKDVLEQLEAKGWQPYVAEGRRTYAQQQSKVLAGNSQTMHSYHLSGYAADIVDKRYGWDIPLHHDFWLDYGRIVLNTKVFGGIFHWGGIWAHPERMAIMERANKEKSDKLITWFSDVAHCELRDA